MYHTRTINLTGRHALQTLQGGKQSERSKVKGKISCQRVKTKLAYVFTTSAADIQRS